MHIAIEGCGHGDLDAIYAEIQRREEAQGCRVDLLLICGDFQAVRNFEDLATMACPVRFRKLGDFHRYYSGEKVAPILTLFIGGNHEASNHLQELYYGGWVCPNIYYLGAAGVVQYGGLRIGGISGIYKSHDYTKGRFEEPPYNKSDERSIYHIRSYDIERLSMIRERLHVIMSHDWPCGIEQYGNLNRLLSQKPFLRRDISTKSLGSPKSMDLLHRVQPLYWFAAHLHAYFKATVQHPVTAVETVDKQQELINIGNPEAISLGDLGDDSSGNDDKDDGIQFEGAPQVDVLAVVEQNPDQIALDISEEDEDDDDDDEEEDSNNEQNEQNERSIGDMFIDTVGVNASALPKFPVTNFLALSKRQSKFEFLEIIEITDELNEAPSTFCYDLEWLAILRATRPYLSLRYRQSSLPCNDAIYREIDKERKWIAANVTDLQIPHNFTMTVQPPTPQEASGPTRTNVETPRFTRNPQTTNFCQMLGIAEPTWQ
ncbi:lariat debranching enzyme, C-terminal domain-containing protein [Syncephalis fuscata]|nr:lariat debranching enzyme, C-terminal domain-containing protein [Syncephalis fuscata]